MTILKKKLEIEFDIKIHLQTMCKKKKVWYENKRKTIKKQQEPDNITNSEYVNYNVTNCKNNNCSNNKLHSQQREREREKMKEREWVSESEKKKGRLVGVAKS